jgi:hypothetical protein
MDTQSEVFVLVINIFSIYANYRELHSFSQLHSIIAVLEFLHFTPLRFERGIIHFLVVNKARVYLVEELKCIDELPTAILPIQT